jgi:hypothetical protein
VKCGNSTLGCARRLRCVAYPVIPTSSASKAIAQLSPEVAEDLYEVLLSVCEDPWSLPRYDEMAPPYLRLMPWRTDLTVLLLIDESRQPEPAVIVLAVEPR